MIKGGSAWSARDRNRIAAEGLTLQEADRQLALFLRGVSPVRLNRPCRVGDGIILLSPEEEENLLGVYEKAIRSKRFVKFVPASGAASRMFEDWHQWLHEEGFATQAEREAFVGDLRRYPFYPDLRAAVAAKGLDVEDLIERHADEAILKFILTEEGLGYGRLPKALLKFHAGPEGFRTALEEHLVEAALYARDGTNCSRLHFTVSSEHEQSVRDRLSQIIPEYQTRCGTVFDIGLSAQETSTNTLAVDPLCRPFRDATGDLVFRPGGHGALLKNLDAITADVIFLKNIDNVVPDRLKPVTIRWKKILAGYLITIQEGIFHRLSLLVERDHLGGTDLEEIAAFCRQRLQVILPQNFDKGAREAQRARLFLTLNRPIRVCGMVKNAGEPGGGPFWVDTEGGEGGQALQIIEESQIVQNSARQRAVWSSSTHFNPVDLVCGVRDFRGQKFSLAEFVDPTRAIITRKSEQGKELLALELPGLWNGSMAFWNTLFVEVPLSTFNPVKVISDLLRPQHLTL